MNDNLSESQMFSANNKLNGYSEYKNLMIIHEGTFADTYRAEKAGKYFLLKTTHRGNEAFLHILEREYEIAKGLSHPNVVSVLGMEMVDELGPCLVMEYVNGANLNNYLATCPSRKERKKLLMQLLSAVSYLHMNNIIHNDLKPQNIMVSAVGGNLKLIDFGLGDDDAHYLFKTLGCTPDFASPELLANASGIDCRSDIYSIGKLVNVILPGAYSSIVRKCLKRDKTGRYSCADAIINAIKRRRNIWLALPIVAAVAVVAVLISLQFSSKKEISAVMESVENAPYKSLIESFDASADSLFNEYSQVVGQQPYKPFGLLESTLFLEQLSILHENYSKSASTDEKDQLYAHYDRLGTECLGELYKIANALPSYEAGMSLEEMNFYTDLIISRKHYTPYKKK